MWTFPSDYIQQSKKKRTGKKTVIRKTWKLVFTNKMPMAQLSKEKPMT